MSSHISSLKWNFLLIFLQPMFLLEPDSNKEATYIRHCAVSSIESGHRSVITDIHWLADTFEVSLGSLMLFFLINCKFSGFTQCRCFKSVIQ